MDVVITLPEELAKILREKAHIEDRPLEELILISVLERLGIDDPKLRVEVYLKLCEKYLVEAEEKLREGDYVQASEKGWGAAAEIVKAVAAKEGVKLRSHRDLHNYVAKLVEKLGDEVRRLWASANELHRNFYEGWLPSKLVEGYLQDVKKFVEILKRMI